jgi:hypothetical protein
MDENVYARLLYDPSARCVTRVGLPLFPLVAKRRTLRAERAQNRRERYEYRCGLRSALPRSTPRRTPMTRCW